MQCSCSQPGKGCQLSTGRSKDQEWDAQPSSCVQVMLHHTNIFPLFPQKRHHQQQHWEPDSGAEVSIRLVVQRSPEPLRHLQRPPLTDYRHWKPDRLPALPHLPTPLACSGNRLVSSDTQFGNPRQATPSATLRLSHLSQTTALKKALPSVT